jgi:hypothetical protein
MSGAPMKRSGNRTSTRAFSLVGRKSPNVIRTNPIQKWRTTGMERPSGFHCNTQYEQIGHVPMSRLPWSTLMCLQRWVACLSRATPKGRNRSSMAR